MSQEAPGIVVLDRSIDPVELLRLVDLYFGDMVKIVVDARRRVPRSMESFTPMRNRCSCRKAAPRLISGGPTTIPARVPTDAWSSLR
ncbi:MAG: hypothetical protein HYS34_10595 [Acidobacteria bacterium]|nr:hypothetical protein [Acidobacteriota bacterium]